MLGSGHERRIRRIGYKREDTSSSVGTQTRGPCPSEDQRAQRPAPQQTREPCSSGSWRQRRLAGGAMSDVTEGGPGGRAGRAEAAAAHVGHVLLHAQACYSVVKTSKRSTWLQVLWRYCPEEAVVPPVAYRATWTEARRRRSRPSALS